VIALDERLAAVAQDLVATFPGCTVPMANELVRGVAAQCDTAPIQDFVPVLTNHICRERLQRAERNTTSTA
jgi:hypothetical protein